MGPRPGHDDAGSGKHALPEPRIALRPAHLTGAMRESAPPGHSSQAQQLPQQLRPQV